MMTDHAAAIIAPVTQITRSVDIYESDGVTPFVLDAPLIGGTVAVDGASTEARRTLDCSLLNIGNKLDRHPGGLWYDKIIKVYRGYTDGDAVWEWQIGEFLIDKIERGAFPTAVKIAGRDYTKKLLGAKFGVPVTFTGGDRVSELISLIAYGGGISKVDIPETDKVTGKDFVFEPDANRWDAIREIATSYNYEVYFRGDGYLTLREQQDPATMEPEYTFQTGDESNLASYSVAVGDTRLYNDIVVTGEGVDPPVVARAVNVNPDNPSNIFRIGTRTYRYNSGFITTQAQAQEVADSFLAVHSLEEYEVRLESIVVPWLEEATVISFIDPDPDPGQATNYFLRDLSIPLGLGTMSCTAKRVLIV